MSTKRPVVALITTIGRVYHAMSHDSEPMLDVAQLAHVELLTPDLDGTLRFFEDILGMRRPGGGVSRSTSGATRSSITIR